MNCDLLQNQNRLGATQNSPPALARDGGRRLPVTESLLGRISRKDNPQMVLGAFEQRWLDTEAITPDRNRPWIALDRVRDPGNLGTIMRTADATGAPPTRVRTQSGHLYAVKHPELFDDI